MSLSLRLLPDSGLATSRYFAKVAGTDCHLTIRSLGDILIEICSGRISANDRLVLNFHHEKKLRRQRFEERLKSWQSIRQKYFRHSARGVEFFVLRECWEMVPPSVL